ncbi:pyruvate kinase [Pilibacter termitis]|uniref:Pyruvate kinase n=1 Tax=Pilibacter termitis TaxID=263852 RepID=A0A1T4PCM9_9ENTE|nr:pyruvate kinase [Pilibacter termitis]SJZ89087.1 pyruvate kinase [Pilibacter termitis]
MKKTKIVSTLGPAVEFRGGRTHLDPDYSFGDAVDVEPTVAKIGELINNGANVFRFNFSHGDHEEQSTRMELVRKAEELTGKHVGLLLDTKGAEIRTTKQNTTEADFGRAGYIKFEVGDKTRISMDENLEGTKEKIAVTYPGLFDDVHVGGHVLFDDGLIDMEILEKDEATRELVVEVKNAGMLGSRKGVNAPGVSLSLPGITEKDEADIRFGLTQGINFIAASFVRKAQDVLDIREILEETGNTHVQIISKIESQEGIDNIDEVIAASDGIMIARGDMGVEIPAENVPLVQKMIIKKVNAVGKTVVTATQMLESMQANPRPTRAEASDVANAVFDGTDATMLSGESANGAYPIESVATMARINEKSESYLQEFGSFELNEFEKTDVTETIGLSVARAAKNLGVKAIVAVTESGYTARMISKYRPQADILALTFDEKTQRSLMLNWGVLPVISEKVFSTDELFEKATAKAVEMGLASEGDLILITAGVPVGERGTTNIMKIQLIGNKLVEGQGVGTETKIGRAVVAFSAEEAVSKVQEGDILVVPSTDADYLPAMTKAAAIIVETGGLTSHAAVVGIAKSIPVVVSAANATNAISDGQIVTVDPRRGIVYKGETAAI